MNKVKPKVDIEEILLQLCDSGLMKLETFMRFVVGIEPTPQQLEVIKDFDSGEVNFFSIASGHGTGKSTLASIIILYGLSVYNECIIPCTAPSSNTLWDVLWRELAMNHKKMIPKFRDRIEIIQKEARRIDIPTIKAVARTSTVDKPESLQGFHSSNLIFIVDEASGVINKTFEGAMGTLTGGNIKFFMFSNPTRLSGYFHKVHTNPNKRWKKYRFNSEESPLVTKEYCQSIAEDWGKDSDEYRVRVLAKFPRSETSSLISLDDISDSITRNIEPDENSLKVGVDCARFGGDSSVITWRRGNCFTQKTYKGLDTMQLAGIVAKVIREDKPDDVYIDGIGLGSGVVDRLHELYNDNKINIKVIDVNVAKLPNDKEKYINLRAELTMTLIKWIKEEGKLINDEELIKELISLKYEISSSGKIQIESKQKRKSQGMNSPDRSDSLMLTFYKSPISKETPKVKVYSF